MKSILSASVCVAALAFALPAVAQTDAPKSDKPMHHHHHMMKHDKMGHKGMHSGKAVDASTDSLNEKSLEAARGGMAPAGMSAPAGTTAPSDSMAPAGAMAPASGGMAPASGATGSMTPTNAPAGH